jgi:hypothetical protein
MENNMLFEVRNIELDVPFEQAHSFIANAKNLPLWTNAFTSVQVDGTALMETEQGEIPIKLKVISNTSSGTIDWKISFPDHSEAIAYSRIIALSETSSAYSFLLTPPPAPLELLEGALAQQVQTLEKELIKLKHILESHS